MIGANYKYDDYGSIYQVIVNAKTNSDSVDIKVKDVQQKLKLIAKTVDVISAC